MVSAANICLLCKGGKALCGHSPCPKLAALNVSPEVEEKISTEFFGPSPSVFVGRYGYPKVSVGPMASFGPEVERSDAPKDWMELSYSEIVELRSMLLRSKQPRDIFSRDSFIQENQELAMASKPTDVELSFTKKPVYHMSFSHMVQPMGPTASLKKLVLAENPKISQKVDYIVSDELKAVDSAVQLYNTQVDVYKITNILASGALGMDEDKKLVPTRWSITATDDIIAKQLIKEVKDFPAVNNFLVFEFEYLSNHFCILLSPGNWEFENFEAWAPGTVWSQGLKKPFIIEEYESYRGRTRYADKQAGGYYAARLGILEGLKNMRRQARVVSFREISEGYTVPLGVWVVRETVRRAMEQKPRAFDTLQSALDHINLRMCLDMKEYTKESRVLRQRRLGDY